MPPRTPSDDDYREAVRVIENIEGMKVGNDDLDDAESLLEPLGPALLAVGLPADRVDALVARARWAVAELRAGRTPPDDLNPYREYAWMFLIDALILKVLAELGEVPRHERKRRLLELNLDPVRANALQGARNVETGSLVVDVDEEDEDLDGDGDA